MKRGVLALSGGVGGAKLCAGLARVLPQGELTIVVNTGDDFEHLGLHICPDIDSVIYALAGLADPLRGWGRRDETWQFMAALRQLGGADWFALGDADLALHVERTRRLAAGEPLSVLTAGICRQLGITAAVLPMSDDAVRTRVRTDAGWLDFQDYFVRRRCEPAVRELQFAGAASARPHPGFVAALADAALRAIILCPSNPFVSVDPILALPGVRAALQTAVAPVVAITPIIRGQAVKGPAAKMMRELGLAVSCQTVAEHYADFADLFISDESDQQLPVVPGLRCVRAPTLMTGDAEREQLARTVLAAVESLRPTGAEYP
jgi:LPPG:FO 2-phospho-L-lactate transferase